MLISEYYVLYTDQKKFGLSYALEEVVELSKEVVTFNWKNVPDELSDISIFVELWLYTCFDYDHELWRSSQLNLQKVQARKPVWEQIYNYVGVPYDRNYCGNYFKIDKVVRHLESVGISEEKAREAYHHVVERSIESRLK